MTTSQPKIRLKGNSIRRLGVGCNHGLAWLSLLSWCTMPLAQAVQPHHTPSANTQAADIQGINIQETNIHAANINAANIHAPSLSADAISFQDQYQNQAIAAWSMQQLGGSDKLITDPWVQQVMNDLVWQLNANARSQAPYGLVIINDASINAFAIPGGVMGINVGTITTADRMDEVAGVMAHEVAHLSQRHYERGQSEKTKALLIQLGGLVAAGLAAKASEGNAATAILASSQSAAMDSAMTFSRANEREADRVGMHIMQASGYDPHAMAEFFAKLNQTSKLNTSNTAFLPSFVRSHPISQERLTEASSRAKQYRQHLTNQPANQRSSTPSQDRFDALKWRLAVLANATNEAELTAASQHSVGASLALAYWYGKQQQFHKAKRQLDQIDQRLATAEGQTHLSALQPLYGIVKANIALEQKDWQQAVTILTQQHRLYPERRDLRLYLADALMSMPLDGQLDKAQQTNTLLKPLTQPNSNDRQAWQLLARHHERLAKASDGNTKTIHTINALRATAQVKLWQAHYTDALAAITQAQTQAIALQNAPLLASINSEKTAITQARDFRP